MSFLSPLKTSIMSVAGFALLVACGTSADVNPPTQSASAAEPMTISYKKGQMLSIISVDSKEGEAAKKAVAEYYKTAFPLAEKYGLNRDGQLMVKANPVGKQKAEAAVFYSWPSAAAEQKFMAEPKWPEIKALRPQAWDDLRIYSDVVEEDTTLIFHPDKTYTIAVAWLNPENPDHYDLYMEGIKEAVTESGGRFMHKMFDPRFESHALKAGAPGQVTLVEWDTAEGLQKFGETEGFKSHAHYLNSGVTRFEIMALGTQ